jgi:hypothetical protein
MSFRAQRKIFRRPHAKKGEGSLNDSTAAPPTARAQQRDRRLAWVAAGVLPLLVFGAVMLLVFKRQPERAIELL